MEIKETKRMVITLEGDEIGRFQRLMEAFLKLATKTGFNSLNLEKKEQKLLEDLAADEK